MQRNKTVLAFFAAILSVSCSYAVAREPSIDFNVKLRPFAVQVSMRASCFTAGKETCFEHDPSAIYGLVVEDDVNKKLEISKKDGRTFCFIAPKDKFSISYRSRVSSYKGPVSEESKLSNLAIGKSLLLFGNRIFIAPVLLPENYMITPAKVKFITVGLKHFMNNINLDKKELNVRDMQRLMSMIIVAGDMNDDDTRIEGKKYYFSFVGDWKRDIRKKIYRAYKTIIERQFGLWGYMPHGDMMVTFIRTKNAGLGAGFQYNNAIIYILPVNINVDDVEFLKLLAHEHFHMWNGYHLRPSTVTRTDLKWFHEGVTSYYALMTLVSSELISEKEFLANLAKTYVKYDSSQNTTDKASQESLREFFTAMALDLEIMRASGLKFNLEKVIRGLRSNKEVLKKGYDNDAIMSELTKTGNWEMSDFFGRYVYTKRKISMDHYFAYLGLKFSPNLALVKDSEKTSYLKWVER